MKVRIMVEFDVELETDGEELDMDVIRTEATECLRIHVENMMDNDNEIERLVDDMSDNIDFLVSGLEYKVTAA